MDIQPFLRVRNIELGGVSLPHCFFEEGCTLIDNDPWCPLLVFQYLARSFLKGFPLWTFTMYISIESE